MRMFDVARFVKTPTKKCNGNTKTPTKKCTEQTKSATKKCNDGTESATKKCNDGTESATKKCKGALCFVFFVCVYRCTVISATYPESASFALHNQPLLPLPLRFSARMFQFLR